MMESYNENSIKSRALDHLKDVLMAELRYCDELYASSVKEILKVFIIKNDDFSDDELKEIRSNLNGLNNTDLKQKSKYLKITLQTMGIPIPEWLRSFDF